MASLEYFLILDTETPSALMHFRTPDRHWGSKRVSGLDAVLDMPKLAVHLKLADVYDGLEFRPRPKLVDPAVSDGT